MARIRTGDTVKINSGDNKGTTAKVVAVLPGKDAALLEGVGIKTRHARPTQMNPRGGSKEVHTPIGLSKLSLVIDTKTGKTSRVGYVKNADGVTTRVARQSKNKEIQ